MLVSNRSPGCNTASRCNCFLNSTISIVMNSSFLFMKLMPSYGASVSLGSFSVVQYYKIASCQYYLEFFRFCK